MANTVVLFLHGMRGNSESTWGGFEKIFQSDIQLEGVKCAFYQYKTPLVPVFSKPLPIQDLATALKTEIDNRYVEHDRIVLVCHSLGGLIARKYVLEEIKSSRPLKVTDVILFATPHLGAGVAWWAAKLFPRQVLFAQLSKSSYVLESINNDWSKLRCETIVRAKYVRGGQDFVVDPLSVAGSPGVEVELIPDRGHSSLVKPVDCFDLGYLIVRNVILKGQKRLGSAQGEIKKLTCLRTRTPGHPYYSNFISPNTKPTI